jgi:hypothetical protein
LHHWAGKGSGLRQLWLKQYQWWFNWKLTSGLSTARILPANKHITEDSIPAQPGVTYSFVLEVFNALMVKL